MVRSAVRRRMMAAALLFSHAATPALPQAPGPAATPAAWEPGRPTTCRFGAWTRNETAEPVAVHAEPSATSAVVGRLPTTGADGSTAYDYSVAFEITAATGDWLQISGATDANNANDDRAARPVYSGSGWIRADAARFGIQSARGYQRPDTASPRLVDLGTDWATELGTLTRILACADEWVLVDLTLHSRRGPGARLTTLPAAERQHRRAWFRGVCASEETTCDMRSVDRE
ncbi:hypothetical protein BN1110_06471 [bacterium YEK0313]|nr:hypothetical protein BN1110_06471 [bacterium YEK0313]